MRPAGLLLVLMGFLTLGYAGTGLFRPAPSPGVRAAHAAAGDASGVPMAAIVGGIALIGGLRLLAVPNVSAG